LVPEQYESSIYDGYYIDKVLYHVKSGKEASVYCCEAQSHVAAELLAVKVYRPLETRMFRNDSIYQEGRYIKDKRLSRAYHGKTKTGRSVQFGIWVSAEYETMQRLYEAGAHVPRPYTQSGDSIIMEFVGSRDSPAPTLNRVRLSEEKAHQLFTILVDDIETWLACGRIHADLSPFNILYWNGDIKIINFPQSVDPEQNASAFHLLERDIRYVVDYFSKYGITANPSDIAHTIWDRHIHWGFIPDNT
jgi:RIO kinase 1